MMNAQSMMAPGEARFSQAQVQIACSIPTHVWLPATVYEAFMACKEPLRGPDWPYDIWSVANEAGLLNLFHFPTATQVWTWWFANASNPSTNTMQVWERNLLGTLNPPAIQPGQQIYWMDGPDGGIGVTSDGDVIPADGNGGNGDPGEPDAGGPWAALAALAAGVVVVGLSLGKKVI